MSGQALPHAHSLLRRYLLAGYVLLIVYASLSPFTGWQAPDSGFLEVLTLSRKPSYTAFDAIANGFAYLPLGLLLTLTLHTRFRPLQCVGGATLVALLLSLAMEYLQSYLPMRASTGMDVLANGLGALGGALLAVWIAPQGWFMRATEWRIALFQRGAGVDFGLALTMLWMFAQINPSLPMLGNVFITEAADRFASVSVTFDLWGGVAVAVNLLLVGLLLQTLFRVRRHALSALLLMLAAVALGKFLMAALLLKSWALLLWLNSEAMLGVLTGLALTAASFWLAPRGLWWAAAAVGIAYLALAVRGLDSDAPLAAMHLYHWHYGHLRNFNAMSQIASAVFPLLLGGYLVWARRRILEQKGSEK